MWTSPISASATGIWRNDKPVPQLLCWCAAWANNWAAVSFSVDKWPLVRQLSPGFSVGLGCTCKKSHVGGQTRPSRGQKPAKATTGPLGSPQQAVPLRHGSALQKLLLAPQRGCQQPQHRPQNTGTAGHPPEAAAPQGLARGAWGSGCSSNVLSIHSGSSRAPCLVGISLFSLAESRSWLAGNPVPSTLAWPGTNR